MAFDTKFLLDVVYPAANSAYVIMTSTSLALPAGYVLLDPIKADPQAAALAMAATAAAQMSVNGMMQDSDVFGLVAWNAAEKSAIVAFRGTLTIWEWIADVSAVPLPYIPNPEAGLAHIGFQLLYENVRNSVSDALTRCGRVKRIIVTGHSLGAAIAVLAAYDIFKNIEPGVVPEVYVLACPRVGDPVFAATFDKAIPVCGRVENLGDLVPEVPLEPTYRHVGQAIEVDGGFAILDPKVAHRLTSYLEGLRKLVPTVSAAGA